MRAIITDNVIIYHIQHLPVKRNISVRKRIFGLPFKRSVYIHRVSLRYSFNTNIRLKS